MHMRVRRSQWQQVRQRVLERDNYTYQKCVPKRKRGTDRLDNLISYYRVCHRYVEMFQQSKKHGSYSVIKNGAIGFRSKIRKIGDKILFIEIITR